MKAWRRLHEFVLDVFARPESHRHRFVVLVEDGRVVEECAVCGHRHRPGDLLREAP